MAAEDTVIRRKLASARADDHDGGPGADRGWRVALARAARDRLKLALEVRALTLGRAGLAEVLELPPDRALIAVLEGPGEGVGVLILAPEVLQAMVEVLTIGRVNAGASTLASRKPTRTDAAMVAPMLDAALADLEQTLAQEADLVWAGGWRYASFLDDPRPLGLMLEDFSYRIVKCEVDLAEGARSGGVLLILPAEGRGRLPHRPVLRAQNDEAQTQRAFAEALAEEVEAATCCLDAVLTRATMPLSQVAGLQVGDVLPLGMAGLDRVSLEALDGRKLAEGRLGQNRGLRALRLGEAVAPGRPQPVSVAPVSAAVQGTPAALRQSA
ncbi:FliM/FliN family flagellar motor C-terminal domain-containing protein [Tabrizicola oligotrophica]|uniref:Flagellar motor switch protein FliM n=1 Tax=Tabrizicola oligotrophica TaxID=2710650 RepID=A0A6M0QQZ1_9RHOB|nr:FliM/FliN family flagellar motor C-terminal domain-containing protein [Tabrizicola oligotrophica]NEY89083.1 FliM/FliN family flagellar motor switch protein [Tabrizicola oligotrophica]